MQFNSIDFMLFFPIVIVGYFVIPKKIRTVWLLAASYYFYMSWSVKYALLIGFSTVITYVCGIAIEHYNKINLKKCSKAIMIVGIVINIVILGIYKYANFFISTIDICLKNFKMHGIDSRLDLLLPVGISFYTFQALGYVIDVYRKNVSAEKNLLRYALFVSFFPQLVAGPIERSKNLLGQLREIDEINLWNRKRVLEGMILMVYGLFLKMVIADRVAVIADNVFNSYKMFDGTELIIGAIAFTIQIYCDFSSYSITAIGAAKIMGITLMENFNAPYFARSIKDFWARWHISLSTWFRDYLYIPLGGNRKGKKRKQINRLIVFMVSGLWHGANWTFVFWGGLHGLYQVIADGIRPIRKKVCEKFEIKTNVFSYKCLEMIITFLLVSFAWIFFRADTLHMAFDYIYRMISRPSMWILLNGEIYNLGLDRIQFNILVVGLIIVFLVDSVREKHKMVLSQALLTQNIWFQWITIIVLIMMIVIFGEYGPSYDAKSFIYFQF